MNSERATLAAGLYLIATPIGAARDITLRALDLLASADVLVAEDTRSLKRLMSIHGIDPGGRPMLSYHDHNGPAIRPKLIGFLREGKSVLYASEAGSPMIADPGYDLAREVIAAGLPLVSAPGPSAVIAALTVSGLPTDRFFFAGFLPTSAGKRVAALKELAAIPATLVFYESPRRIKASLRSAVDVLGGTRQAVVCRELTKKFEEVMRDSLEGLAAALDARELKGELVLLIDRAPPPSADPDEIKKALETALETLSVRDAADSVARSFRLKKRDVYQMALALHRTR